MVTIINKLLAILIILIVACSGIYVYHYDSENYMQYNFSVSNANFNNPCHLNYSISKNTLNIVSNRNVSGSWAPLTSRIISVNSGEKLLLSFDVKYENTAQSSLKICGNITLEFSGME